MAIASVGTLGIGASSTSNASWTFATATNTLASGDFGLLFISTDNLATVDGASSNHTSVSGGTGYWTKVCEHTNTVGGVAGDGVTASLWLFEATGTLSLATTITMNLSGSVTDKACSFWKFTKGANTSIALDTAPATNPIVNTTDASNGFGSSAFSGLASAARLYVRALAKEANSTTNITVSTSFTAITNNRSRNNASAVGVWGEFRINTSTGETSNPTLAVSGDTAGIFAALIEVAVVDPTTLTDNFDDNSKDAAKWGTDAPFGRAAMATAGTVSEANQRTEIVPATSTQGFTGRRSLNYYDMTGKRIYAKLSVSATLPASQEAYLGFGWNQSKFAEALVEQVAGPFFLFDGNDNSSNRGGTFTASGTWVGLRHNTSDDTLHVETAPGSEDPPSTWTDLGGVTRDQRIPIKGVLLGLGAGSYDGANSSPVTVRWDGFNTASSGASIGAASGTSTAAAVPIVSGSASGSGTAAAKAQSIGSASGIGSAAAVAQEIGSASGSGSASAVGQSTVLAPGSASGVGTAVGIGSSTALSTGAASGTGSASAVGTGIVVGVGSAAGTGSATAVALGIGASAGAGAASGVGASTSATAGSSVGAGAASATGAPLGIGAGSSAGIAAVSGIGRATAAANGSSAGFGSATGVGSALAAGSGSASGIGAATGVSSSSGTSSGAGAASGSGAASAVGFSTAAIAGSASGAGTAAGIGSGIAAGQGSASGTGAAAGTGRAVSQTAGASAGTGVALATGSAQSLATGASSGFGAANANGTGLFVASGAASGSSTASATGTAYSTGVGLSAGFGVAVGAGQSIARADGTAAGQGSAIGVGSSTVLHPAVTTPAARRAAGELAPRAATGTAQSRSSAGPTPDRTATGSREDRAAVGNLQPRRSAA